MQPIQGQLTPPQPLYVSLSPREKVHDDLVSEGRDGQDSEGREGIQREIEGFFIGQSTRRRLVADLFGGDLDNRNLIQAYESA